MDYLLACPLLTQNTFLFIIVTLKTENMKVKNKCFSCPNLKANGYIVTKNSDGSIHDEPNYFCDYYNFSLVNVRPIICNKFHDLLLTKTN
jgi:hypothetical protein